MISFFKNVSGSIIAVDTDHKLENSEIEKLKWLFNDAQLLDASTVEGKFVGPRREMITPWSTNAVEITQNMGLSGVKRIEEFFPTTAKNPTYDKMLQRLYENLGADIFEILKKPDEIVYISDIEAYNEQEGLALNPEEVDYLKSLSAKLNRPLTDSEVFGFSQVNSEHCRHKIFNGVFVIDGEEKPSSLFKLIKKTSQENPNKLVSAYKDNVAFVEGPVIEQFAPKNPQGPDFLQIKDVETVISLKAETHNFPTTVEPFNGAATGTGGEIRDRLGGGKASLPIAGTAVYMTSYPRTEENRVWEASAMAPRKWLYQTPEEILIKASNGASDFGNKFGQPLICGSVLTFEHKENGEEFAYDKVIMLAGGVGFAAKRDALKGEPKPHESVVLMGGDNYRIGMGGGAVSSVNTGQYDNSIELNAVQRANPEMQKRVSNVIRALAESDSNPIVSIHDHGAGGHVHHGAGGIADLRAAGQDQDTETGGAGENVPLLQSPLCPDAGRGALALRGRLGREVLRLLRQGAVRLIQKTVHPGSYLIGEGAGEVGQGDQRVGYVPTCRGGPDQQGSQQAEQQDRYFFLHGAALSGWRCGS